MTDHAPNVTTDWQEDINRIWLLVGPAEPVGSEPAADEQRPKRPDERPCDAVEPGQPCPVSLEQCVCAQQQRAYCEYVERTIRRNHQTIRWLGICLALSFVLIAVMAADRLL